MVYLDGGGHKSMFDGDVLDSAIPDTGFLPCGDWIAGYQLATEW